MTFEHGRMSTWRFPRFSALEMLFRQSARTDMRTILPTKLREGRTRQRQATNDKRRRERRDAATDGAASKQSDERGAMGEFGGLG